MDIWVVATAAGAGYLAQYWQSVVKDKDFISGSGIPIEDHTKSIPLCDKELTQKKSEFGKLTNGDQRCVFQRQRLSKLSSPNTQDLSSNLNDEFLNISSIDVTPAREVTYNSGLSEDMRNVDNNDSGTWGCESKFPDNAWNFNAGSGFSTFRRSLKSKRSRRCYSVKPITSLESCLSAQMSTEHCKMEENVFSSLSSQSKPTVRPFFVTDGNQVISRASNNFSRVLIEGTKLNLQNEGFDWRELETLNGVQPHCKTGLIELTRKAKSQSRKVKNRRSRTSNIGPTGTHLHSQGLPDGMILFCLGIAFGVMSSILANKKEVDNLNEQLEQSQNLIQDLQEELQMTDSLTVKELTSEAGGSQSINDTSADSKEPINSVLFRLPAASSPKQKTDEKEESMSKIEAELQAELQRLELNMNASSERRFYGLSEIDTDLVADVVHGEFRADVIRRTDDLDHDTSSNSTNGTPPANYAVSPKQLSLRLHEIIQSRLEERIAELESELQDTQRRLQSIEAERINSQSDISSSPLGSPSSQESSTLMGHGNATACPLLLNLSGDALNAYNEAYDEFARIAEIEKNPPDTISKSKWIDDADLNSHHIGGSEKGSSPLLEIKEGNFRNVAYDEIKMWERSRGSNEAGESEEEDDEFGKMLIKQIVEKTRQGSPVVLNAQRVLYSMDE